MANEKKMSQNTKKPTTDVKGRCGSPAGYQAHRRRGERACYKCRTAHTAAGQARARGEKTKSPTAKPRRRHIPVEQGGVDPMVNPVELPPEPENPTPAEKPVPAEPETKPEPPSKPVEVTSVPQVPEGVPEPPAWLKAKGLALWVDVTQAYDLNPAGLTLLGEACRTTDRLERMAGALASRSTLWFEIGDLDQATELGVPIVVNGMLAEARQLQTTLRQTLDKLGVLSVDNAKKAAKSPLDELAERRAKRLAEAGG